MNTRKRKDEDEWASDDAGTYIRDGENGGTANWGEGAQLVTAAAKSAICIYVEGLRE
jgi:hypothetical protein